MMKLFLGLVVVGVGVSAFAAEAPKVGRAAAAKYFERRAPSAEKDDSSGGGGGDHYLQLHVGKFMNGQAWDWAQKGREDNAGSYSWGVTYRMYEWASSTDLSLRIDFNEYDVGGQKPQKMSLMPLLTFPDANSRFPLYFGAGAGVGIFFKQIPDKSPIALDYQLIMGARFFDVFNNCGFFLETGMKNSLLLTSSGQFNGVFLTGGAVFTF